MADAVTLSICTASRNRATSLARLGQALLSLHSRWAPPSESARAPLYPLEWLIADSYDDPTQVAPGISSVNFFDGRLQCVRCWPPAGATSALRSLFPRCLGTYVALLADDLVPEPGALEMAVAYLDEHPSVGQVAAYVRTPWHRCHVPPWHGILYGQYWVVRRTVGETVDWYEPNCYHASVDNDFSAKILEAGWGVVAVPGVCLKDTGLHSDPPQTADDTARIEAKWTPHWERLAAQWKTQWQPLSGPWECGRTHE